MSDRLTDEEVSERTIADGHIGRCESALAREVEASRKLIAAAKVLADASETEMIRLSDLAHPNGDFHCPSDPCPFCTALEEFNTALMEYEDE